MSLWGQYADLVPWDELRREYHRLRGQTFNAPRPPGRYLRVEGHTADELVAALGERYWRPNEFLSYYERGEVINLARVYYVEQTEFVAYDRTLWDVIAQRPGQPYYIEWWQDHARGWAGDGFFDFDAHHEAEPSENDRAHIEGVGFNRAAGRNALAAAFDDAGIGYTQVRWSP